MDEVTKSRKRTRKRLRSLERLHEDCNHPADGHIDYAAPGHALAEGFTAEMNNEAKPDVDKASAAQMAAASGNPVAGYPDGSNRQVNSRELAFQHGDLRQSSTDFSAVLSRLRTVRGNVMDLGVSPETAGGFSHAGQVALASFDAASHAGSMTGVHGNDVLNEVNHNPQRPDYHPARTSATADNGTHSSGSQQASCSTPRQSMKASRLDIMKATQRVIT